MTPVRRFLLGFMCFVLALGLLPAAWPTYATSDVPAVQKPIAQETLPQASLKEEGNATAPPEGAPPFLQSGEPGVDLAVPTEESDGQEALGDPLQTLLTDGAVELQESRSKYGQYYELADGRRAALISSAPIHYKASAGTYQLVDDSIVSTNADDRYAFTNAANSFSVYFPSEAERTSDILFRSQTGAEMNLWGQGELWYQSASGDRELLYQAKDVKGVPEGDVIRYPNRYPHVTEVFRVKYEGIKHNYVVSQAISFPDDRTTGIIEFQEVVTLPAGSHLLIDGNVQTHDFVTDLDIYIVDTNGNPFATFLAPWAHEGTNRSFDPEVNAELSLSHRVNYLAEGRVQIAVRVPLDWLAEPGRIYPVTVDPSLYYYENHSYDDCYSWGSELFNYSGEYMKVGYGSDYGLPFYLAFMTWHDVDIPPGSTIDLVKLYYKPYDNYSNTCSFKWQFEDSDNAAPCAYEYPAGRNYVYHSNYFSPYTTSWSAGIWRLFSNFSAGLQDVIDQPGWSSGNNVGMKWCAYSALGGYRQIYSYDYGSSSAPYLYVEYTPPSLEHCYTCPTYDYGPYTPSTTYSTHSASFGAGGCRWYRFSLTAGEPYIFTTCEGGGSYSSDTVFTLYNSVCSSVAENDDYCDLGSQIEYTPTSTGSYYLQVRNYSDGAESYTLAYKREISFLPPTLEESGCYVTPGTINPGGQLTVYYRIHNPNSYDLTVGLGCSIKKSGTTTWISDPPHDKYVTAPPGYSNHDRYFDVPCDAVSGSYDVAWGLWEFIGPGGDWDYLEKTNQFTVVDQAYAVYGIISDFAGGTDGDGDGYYETLDFNIAIDGDVLADCATTVYGKMICTTTGQAWWSASPWTISGTATDYHYFPFDETDFAGHFTGNTDLYFTVELWNDSKTTKLATDTSVSGEPVKIDEYAAQQTRILGDRFVDKTAKIGIPVILEARLQNYDWWIWWNLPGETLHFDIYYDGQWHEIPDDGIGSTSFVTDGDGIASVYYTVPKTLAPGSYSIRARYDGSSAYEPCSLSRSLTIKKPKWLVMIYLCADNDLEVASIEDFYDEMWQARNNDEVSICAVYDRTPLDEGDGHGYSSDHGDWSSTRYYRFGNDTLIYNDWNEQNMGSQTVLQTFANTAMGQCAAENVALILWNHGYGWKLEQTAEGQLTQTPIRELRQEVPLPQALTEERVGESASEWFRGVCYDDTGDHLALQEVRGVLDSITNGGANPVDVLGYDACLMGMLEVAYDASPYVSFLVASEDNESWDGWEYHRILGASAIGSTTTPEQWGQKIVDESIQATLGCWDLSYAAERFDEVASMSERLREILAESRADVVAARAASHKFPSGSQCFMDLRQFASDIASRTGDATLQSRAQTVATGLANTAWRVAWRSTHTDAATLGGLSIYFPEGTWDSGYNDYFQSGYLLFTSNPNQSWDDFLVLYFDEPDIRVEPTHLDFECPVSPGGSGDYAGAEAERSNACPACGAHAANSNTFSSTPAPGDKAGLTYEDAEEDTGDKGDSWGLAEPSVTGLCLQEERRPYGVKGFHQRGEGKWMEMWQNPVRSHWRDKDGGRWTASIGNQGCCGDGNGAGKQMTTSLRDPAALYCEEMGYEYKVVKTEDGEQGICVLPNGEEHDAWAFHAGECGTEFSYCAKMGWPVATEGKGDSFAKKCTTCILPDGSRKTVSELLNLSEKCTVGASMLSKASLDERDIKEGESSLPDHFDWRNKDGQNWMTTVKAQGSCGSCWAFSAVGTVESAYNISYGNADLDLDLSEEYLVSDCYADWNCCGGLKHEALNFIRENGITDEACFPYVDVSGCTCSDGTCDTNCNYRTGGSCSDATCSDRCPDWSSRLKEIDQMGSVASDIETIKQYLIEKGPLAASMGIGDDFGGYFDGDIYRCTDDSGTNHAIVIAGYDETEDYWIVKNSWGASWNDDGYFELGFGECSIENKVYYATVSAPANCRVVTVYNDGNGDLGVNNIAIGYEPGESSGWLDASPKSFTVSPSGSQPVNVCVDCTGLSSDTYHGWLDIYSNDPDENPVRVTVTLQVTLPQYTLTIGVDGTGTTDPSPGTYTYDCCTDVTITAIETDPCWEFERWSGDASGTSSSVTVHMDGDKTVTSHFARYQYDLTVVSSPPEGGEVTGGGTYDCCTDAAITADPSPGCVFTGWTGEGIADPESASTTVHMDGDKTVTAHFFCGENVYELMVVADPPEGGDVTGSGIYDYCTYAAITATAADECWYFTGWTGEDIADPESASTTVHIDGDKTVTAHFARYQYDLTVVASPPEGGEVTGGGTYDCCTDAAITADPSPGCVFTGWTGEGIADPESASTTVHIDGDKTVTGMFACGVETIHIDADPFLFCYSGATRELPEALTNIGPEGLNVVTTVWGIVEGQWVSYDAEIGAGFLTELVNGKAYVMTHEGGVCNDWELTPPPTPTPTPTPDTIHIDSDPFLFCYPGATCDLPEAFTNIGPDGLNVVTTVWGTVDGQWVSYDAEIGAGFLTELVNGKAYVMTHQDGVCNDWVMPQ